VSAELEEIELDDANQVSHAVECARSVVLRAVAVLRSLSLGAKVFIAKRKGNIHVDVRARGRAKRSAPRKAAACAPSGTYLDGTGSGELLPCVHCEPDGRRPRERNIVERMKIKLHVISMPFRLNRHG